MDNAKIIYFRSLDKNIEKYNKNLIKYSIDIDKHNNLQRYVKKIFKSYETRYKNLNLISFDNIFCKKDLNKCIVGNHENSFYIDDNHLSANGVDLTYNKIKKIFDSF